MLDEKRINDLYDCAMYATDPTAANFRFRFVRAIEREATAPLLDQIKEDEALMRDVLEALTAEPEMHDGARIVAIEALRKRLEAKK